MTRGCASRPCSRCGRLLGRIRRARSKRGDLPSRSRGPPRGRGAFGPRRASRTGATRVVRNTRAPWRSSTAWPEVPRHEAGRSFAGSARVVRKAVQRRPVGSSRKTALVFHISLDHLLSTRTPRLRVSSAPSGRHARSPVRSGGPASIPSLPIAARAARRFLSKAPGQAGGRAGRGGGGEGGGAQASWTRESISRTAPSPMWSISSRRVRAARTKAASSIETRLIRTL